MCDRGTISVPGAILSSITFRVVENICVLELFGRIIDSRYYQKNADAFTC